MRDKQTIRKSTNMTNNSSYVFISYKSDELEKMYRKQLERYRVAAEKITGKPVGGTYLYFLRRGKIRKVEFDNI